MPKFDFPGRAEPVEVVLHYDFREYRFPLPFETEDPIALRLLRAHPGLVEVVSLGPEPVPEPEPEPKPFKKHKPHEGGER